MPHPFDAWTRIGNDNGGRYDWGILVGPYDILAAQHIIFAISHDFVSGATGLPAPGLAAIRYTKDLGSTWASCTFAPNFAGTYINPVAMWMTVRGTLQALVMVSEYIPTAQGRTVLEIHESDATLVTLSYLSTLVDSGVQSISAVGFDVWSAEMMEVGQHGATIYLSTWAQFGRHLGSQINVSGLWKSTDDGLTWGTLTPPVAPSQGAVNLRVFPNGIVHFHGRRSTDGGASWGPNDQPLMGGGHAHFTYAHSIGLQPNPLTGTGSIVVSCAGADFDDPSVPIGNANWSRRAGYAFPGTTEAVFVTTNGGLLRVIYTANGGESIQTTDIDTGPYGGSIPSGFRGIGRLSDGRLVAGDFNRYLAISTGTTPAGILVPPSFCNIEVPTVTVVAPGYLPCAQAASFMPLQCEVR